MTTYLTIQTNLSAEVDLSVDGNDVEVTTREVGEYGVVVRLPLPVLRAALDGLAHTTEGESRPESPDLLDGGVTCAAIEREAEQAEQIRLGKLVETIRDGGGAVEVYGVTIAPTADVQHMAERIDAATARAEKAEHPRPLVTGDIFALVKEREELIHRKVAAAYSDHGGSRLRVASAVYQALTEDPQRPEGAEELETVLGLNAGEWTNGAQSVRALADLLASHGVRAPGAES